METTWNFGICAISSRWLRRGASRTQQSGGCTAQPSLSRQIRDLELEVGVKLLERGARGINLTAAGRVFVVWMVGAEGDNRLHGFRGDTGEALFGTEAGPAMSGLHHFQTLIANKDRIFVGADGRIYAFVF